MTRCPAVLLLLLLLSVAVAGARTTTSSRSHRHHRSGSKKSRTRGVRRRTYPPDFISADKTMMMKLRDSLASSRNSEEGALPEDPASLLDTMVATNDTTERRLKKASTNTAEDTYDFDTPVAADDDKDEDVEILQAKEKDDKDDTNEEVAVNNKEDKDDGDDGDDDMAAVETEAVVNNNNGTLPVNTTTIDDLSEETDLEENFDFGEDPNQDGPILAAEEEGKDTTEDDDDDDDDKDGDDEEGPVESTEVSKDKDKEKDKDKDKDKNKNQDEDDDEDEDDDDDEDEDDDEEDDEDDDEDNGDDDPAVVESAIGAEETLNATSTSSTGNNATGALTFDGESDLGGGGSEESLATVAPTDDTDDFFPDSTNDNAPQLAAEVVTLLETVPCLPLEDAYIFMSNWPQNEYSCMEDPTSCAGGCCRLSDFVFCDVDNEHTDLPCICNQNTAR